MIEIGRSFVEFSSKASAPPEEAFAFRVSEYRKRFYRDSKENGLSSPLGRRRARGRSLLISGSDGGDAPKIRERNMAKIDPLKKAALIACIQSREAPEREILIPFQQYFDGYEDDQCTICANNTRSISTGDFSERLQQIQERAEVEAVYVRFYEYDDALENEDLWIGSDSIYILAKADLSQVRDWFSGFGVSDVWEERDLAKFDGLDEIPPGYRLVAVWWD
jgi:hypothetical protein